MSDADSSDEGVVVLPVSGFRSDGTEEMWRLNDSQFKYRQIDDSRWRQALAEMWVERTGAKEPGKSPIVVCLVKYEYLVPFYCIKLALQINICGFEQVCSVTAFITFLYRGLSKLKISQSVMLEHFFHFLHF